jgi:hypothetical protein
MADEQSGDGPSKPPDRLKNLSPLQFRVTEPLRLPGDPIASEWEQDKERRAGGQRAGARVVLAENSRHRRPRGRGRRNQLCRQRASRAACTTDAVRGRQRRQRHRQGLLFVLIILPKEGGRGLPRRSFVTPRRRGSRPAPIAERLAVQHVVESPNRLRAELDVRELKHTIAPLRVIRRGRNPEASAIRARSVSGPCAICALDPLHRSPLERSR